MWLVDMLLVLAVAAGVGVVAAREPRRMVLALSLNGLVLAALFAVLQAPDVAFAEIAVGSAAVPLLYLVTLARLRRHALPGDAHPRTARKPDRPGGDDA